MYQIVITVGRLGNDVDMKYTSSGTAIASFSLATDESYVKDGEKVERTEWHNVTAFGKAAEFVSNYACKGTLMLVAGKMRTEKWEDKEGNKRSRAKLIADRVKILGGWKDTEKSQKPATTEETKQTELDDEVPF